MKAGDMSGRTGSVESWTGGRENVHMAGRLSPFCDTWISELRRAEASIRRTRE